MNSEILKIIEDKDNKLAENAQKSIHWMTKKIHYLKVCVNVTEK